MCSISTSVSYILYYILFKQAFLGNEKIYNDIFKSDCTSKIINKKKHKIE
jgi:hypothetical protein